MTQRRWCNLLLAVLIVVVAQETGANIESMKMRPRFPVMAHVSESKHSWETRVMKQPVDHFNFQNKETFEQRYLFSQEFWDYESGPFFVYTGNEGPIESFAENTGFIWELASEYQAAVIYMEHRYYGNSLPYGNHSFEPEFVGYLSVEQALADYASLIAEVLKVNGASDRPVVAFGGSYGGMLSAWLRTKYPHIVVGSVASSAPVAMFHRLSPPDGFNTIVTQDYRSASANCSDLIHRSWALILENAVDQGGRDRLSDIFRLCSPLKSALEASSLLAWLYNAWYTMAMLDYPYPTNFLTPLPANPVAEACSNLNMTKTASNDDVLAGIAAAGRVFYNTSGEATCFDTSAQSIVNQGWEYQSCTEMFMPMGANGVTDMFGPIPWQAEYLGLVAACEVQWQVMPRIDWAETSWGGRDLSGASNIVFTNGDRDPWMAGGVVNNVSSTVVAFLMEGAAHHLDLRESNNADPTAVVNARNAIRNYVSEWVSQPRPSKGV